MRLCAVLGQECCLFIAHTSHDTCIADQPSQLSRGWWTKVPLQKPAHAGERHVRLPFPAAVRLKGVGSRHDSRN